MNLKNYQKTAVEDIIRHSVRILEAEDPGIKTVVLDSFMGSGKTVMASQSIDKLNEIDWIDLVHIWLTPGKGELDEQSRNKLSEFSITSKCLLADELKGSSHLDKGTLVVINWEKLNRGEGNKLNREGDYASFREIINNTRQHCKIVLWVDESHYGYTSDKSIDITQEQINPDLIIEMSATPLLKNAHVVKVDIEDVIREGMIKREAIINPRPKLEDIENFDDKDSLQLVVEASINQRDLVVGAYKRCGCNINPLVLIQLPDAEKGDELRSAVEKILNGAGYFIEKGTIAVWTAKDHINIDSISDNDNSVCFLIFKQAVALGWDCPRAHILTVLRESKNSSFRIQTLGRIYRTAERMHYGDPILDSAYIFTNMPGAKANIEEDAFTVSPNRLKDITSTVKRDFPRLAIESFYKPRESQGDIDARFYADREFVAPAFERTVGIALTKDPKENLINAEKCGIQFSVEYVEEVMSDTKLFVKDLMNTDILKAEKTLLLKLNDRDVRFVLESKIIRPTLNGFPPVRSIPTVKQAIYIFFNKYFGLTEKDNGAVKIQRIIIQNPELFIRILDLAIKEYKEWKEKTDKDHKPESRTAEWSVPEIDHFSSDLYEEIKCDNYAMSKCCLKKKRPATEKYFEELLMNNRDVLFWYKNGDKGEQYFGIRYLDLSGKERSFYPDYVTINKKGEIGIWDTKAGITASNEEAGPRSDFLQNYIQRHSHDGVLLKGGIVIEDGGVLKFFGGYKYDTKDSKHWIPVVL